MTALAWDKVGERRFETGVDRGVLYLPDGAVVWNGLTGVDESSDQEMKSYYVDGVKYLNIQTPGDFSATLKAFTYPDEFDEVIGIYSDPSGLSIHNQKAKPFDLSYRTRIGNDLLGLDFGYKIHILYNLLATPSEITFASAGEDISPLEFSWDLVSTPVQFPGYKPTAHVSINSLTMDPEVLVEVEKMLYGTEFTQPFVPTIEQIESISVGGGATFSVTDHGDGTWTATSSDDAVTMLDSETFEIDSSHAVILDPDTFELSSS